MIWLGSDKKMHKFFWGIYHASYVVSNACEVFFNTGGPHVCGIYRGIHVLTTVIVALLFVDIFWEILLDNLIKGPTVQREDPDGDARADAMNKRDSGQPASFVDDHVAVLEDEVQL